ncbi:MAG TPA: DUF4142 domain-containing protein [Sphingomonas sp.]
MKRLTISALVLASAGLAVAGCSSNNGDSATTQDSTTAAATDTTPAAGQAIADTHVSSFLTDAAETDNDEIKIGQLAASQGSSKGVKDFGQMLVDDHTKHKAQGAKLASSMGVAPTDATTPEGDAEYQKLQGLKGADFDKEFASAMVSGHQKAIDKFQQEANSSDPAQVTDFAKQSLPTLQTHLDTAKKLQKG